MNKARCVQLFWAVWLLERPQCGTETVERESSVLRNKVRSLKEIRDVRHVRDIVAEHEDVR